MSKRSISDLIWSFRLDRFNPLKFSERGESVSRSHKYAVKSAKLIKKGMKGVEQEAVETRAMAESFFKMLEYKLDLRNRKDPPTEQEVKEAIEQLKDVGRFSLFATISIIPGGGFSLIGLELLAQKLGVKRFTLVPSAFRRGKNKSDKSKDTDTKDL